MVTAGANQVIGTGYYYVVFFFWSIQEDIRFKEDDKFRWEGEFSLKHLVLYCWAANLRSKKPYMKESDAWLCIHTSFLSSLGSF